MRQSGAEGWIKASFSEPIVKEKDIEGFIGKIKSKKCDDKEYQQKLEQKLQEDKLEKKPDYVVFQGNRLTNHEPPPNRTRCGCCPYEIDWLSGRIHCVFCGKLTCKDCILKKRLVPQLPQAKQICVKCQTYVIHTMRLQRHYTSMKIAKAAFNKLVDDQIKLEKSLELERKNVIKQSEGADKADYIARNIKIEKLRMHKKSLQAEVSQLQDRLTKAKTVQNDLKRQYKTKHESKKRTTRSISQNPIDDDQELEAPQLSTHQANPNELQINQEFMNRILEMSNVNHDEQQEEYKHKCQCGLM